MIYPKNEQVWVEYYTSSHKLMFIVTSKSSREFYFLYEMIDGVFKKLGKAKSPLELEEKFNVCGRLRE